MQLRTVAYLYPVTRLRIEYPSWALQQTNSYTSNIWPRRIFNIYFKALELAKDSSVRWNTTVQPSTRAIISAKIQQTILPISWSFIMCNSQLIAVFNNSFYSKYEDFSSMGSSNQKILNNIYTRFLWNTKPAEQHHYPILFLSYKVLRTEGHSPILEAFIISIVWILEVGGGIENLKPITR